MHAHRPFTAVFAGLALVLTIATGTVLAKGEDTVATLDTALPVDPAPGTTVTIGWSLDIAPGDGTTRPFTASDVFILVSPPSGSGDDPIRVVARQDKPGHYLATVTVPAAGLGDVAFGLRGTACYADGRCEPSDEYFRVAPTAADAAVDTAAAPVATVPDATASSPTSTTRELTWLPLLALVALGAVGITLAALARVRARDRAAAA